jgi:predicted NUDIX family phosphoesterase
MNQVPEEHVLVVPTEVFKSVGYFQGFCSTPQSYLEELLKPENVSYRPRAEMESDPSFKQLIPYVLLHHTDHEGVAWVFQYTRGKGQGESRLHQKRSVGIGGHISSDDASVGDAYEIGMQRELEEEIHIGSEFSSACVGLINDDETEVGRVHLGIVHRFDLQSPTVSPREEGIQGAGFQPVSEMLQKLDEFETWSSICLKSLFAAP